MNRAKFRWNPWAKYAKDYIQAYTYHKKYCCNIPLSTITDDLWRAYNMGGEI